MLKSLKKTNQASNSVSEESESLDEEQKKRQKQLAKIIQNFRSQRIKDYESDEAEGNNEEGNEQF